MDSTDLRELVAGYSTFAEPSELAPVARSEEMASSPFCGFLYGALLGARLMMKPPHWR